jgi:MFS superfamily sulfate permease-like transporter
MPTSTPPLAATLPRDLTASIAVFLVALPLCLGIALASNAPLFSGIISGIVGGIAVGILSGSHKSVSGPAAGLTAIVAAQIAALGGFEPFLAAVAIAGVMQILMGTFRLGFIAAFFPTSVIKGLLAAIGLILILKQIPHVLGHDADAEGEMSFQQPDNQNTFSELAATASDLLPGATLIGLLSILLLLGWDKVKALRKLPVPPALVVVLFGVGVNLLLRRLGHAWEIKASHLVQVPVAGQLSDFAGFLQTPALSHFANPLVYKAAFTVALVASLETLLNLEAVDKIDPDQRQSPPNRELVAQGIGNLASGLIGGLPMTSVIVRSSVNINAGGRTKLSAILHGILLIGCVVAVPRWLNEIPLSALAAILIVTGFKLASPKLFREMWKEGRPQFLPFVITIAAIVFTDLLTGVIIGLGISILFILHSNLRRPLRRIVEKHAGGDVLRIELANQVSFLNKAALERTIHEVPRGGRVIIDARKTDYIDPDIRDLLSDLRDTTAAAHGIELGFLGLKEHNVSDDHVQFIDYASLGKRSELTPSGVLAILKAGNERFADGHSIRRDARPVIDSAAPMAAVLSCSDAPLSPDFVFDAAPGELACVAVADAAATAITADSLARACSVNGARLIVVLHHSHGSASPAMAPADTIRTLRSLSPAIDDLVSDGTIAIVAGLLDTTTGSVSFSLTPDSGSAARGLPGSTPA